MQKVGWAGGSIPIILSVVSAPSLHSLCSSLCQAVSCTICSCPNCTETAKTVRHKYNIITCQTPNKQEQIVTPEAGVQ